MLNHVKETMAYRPATDEDRKAFKHYSRELYRVLDERDRIERQPSEILMLPSRRGGLKFVINDRDRKLPDLPTYPVWLNEITCGARTRAGTPCKQRYLESNLRCRFHGGLSTGPKTPEGKKRSAMNGLIPKRCNNMPPIADGPSEAHESSKIQARLTIGPRG